MEVQTSEHNDLLIVALEPVNFTISHYQTLIWELVFNNTHYEIDEKDPQIHFVPELDKFLLIAEAYVAPLSNIYLHRFYSHYSFFCFTRF